jgi:hypothetical protein
MSMPTTAAGSRPSGVNTAPPAPTSSGTVKTLVQPSDAATSAKPPVGDVIGTTRRANSIRSPPTLSRSDARRSRVATAIPGPLPAVSATMIAHWSSRSLPRGFPAGATRSSSPWRASLSNDERTNESRGLPPRSPRESSLWKGWAHDSKIARAPSVPQPSPTTITRSTVSRIRRAACRTANSWLEARAPPTL